MKREDLLQVNVIDNKSLAACIQSELMIANNGPKSIVVDQLAIIPVKGGFIIVDDECCYTLSDTTFHNRQKITEVMQLKCALKTQTPIKNGHSITHEHFYTPFEVDHVLKHYCEPEIKSLRDFMGSRYNYNPRIISNMRNFFKELSYYENP